VKKKRYCKLYKRSHIYVPILGANGNIVFSLKEYKEICKKKHEFDYTDDHHNANCLMNDTNGSFVIGIFEDEDTHILHECVHIALWLLKIRDIDPSDSLGELLAYLTEYLYEEVKKKKIQ